MMQALVLGLIIAACVSHYQLDLKAGLNGGTPAGGGGRVVNETVTFLPAALYAARLSSVSQAFNQTTPQSHNKLLLNSIPKPQQRLPNRLSTFLKKSFTQPSTNRLHRKRCGKRSHNNS